MEKTSPRRPEGLVELSLANPPLQSKIWRFWRKHIFPSEEEARAWAAYAQGILVNKWRWTSLDWEFAP